MGFQIGKLTNRDSRQFRRMHPRGELSQLVESIVRQLRERNSSRLPETYRQPCSANKFFSVLSTGRASEGYLRDRAVLGASNLQEACTTSVESFVRSWPLVGRSALKRLHSSSERA
jgi:hypothetical protein